MRISQVYMFHQAYQGPYLIRLLHVKEHMAINVLLPPEATSTLSVAAFFWRSPSDRVSSFLLFYFDGGPYSIEGDCLSRLRNTIKE